MRKIKILTFSIITFAVIAYILGTISWETEFFKNIALSYLGKKFQKEIYADSLKITFLKKIEVTNLKVSARNKKGFTFSAQRLKFDYNLLNLFSGGLVGRCEAKNVKVLRENLAFLKPLFELLLLSRPLENLRFHNVNANIYLENRVFIPKNLEAVGHNIRVYGDGNVSSNEVIDYKLKFLIAPKRLGETLNIFELFKGLISGEEESEWVSLSFRIKGKKDNLLIIPWKD